MHTNRERPNKILSNLNFTTFPLQVNYVKTFTSNSDDITGRDPWQRLYLDERIITSVQVVQRLYQLLHGQQPVPTDKPYPSQVNFIAKLMYIIKLGIQIFDANEKNGTWVMSTRHQNLFCILLCHALQSNSENIDIWKLTLARIATALPLPTPSDAPLPFN